MYARHEVVMEIARRVIREQAEVLRLLAEGDWQLPSTDDCHVGDDV